MFLALFSILFNFSYADSQICKKPPLLLNLPYEFKMQMQNIFNGMLEKKFPNTGTESAQDYINTYQSEVFAAFPELLLVGKLQSCKAFTLTYAMCETYKHARDAEEFSSVSNDEETDALRHFIMTALVAKKVGTYKASLLMTAHEGVPADTDLDELLKNDSYSPGGMDIYNNRKAIMWVKSLSISPNEISEQQIVEAAVKHLRTGQLRTLKAGISACADRRIHKKSWAQIKKEYDHIFKDHQQFEEVCAEDMALPRVYDILTDPFSGDIRHYKNLKKAK